MTAVTLGNGQRAFVNSQGAFFDANGNQIKHQSVAAATKGTPAITAAPVIPQKSAPTQGVAANRGNLGAASFPNTSLPGPSAPSKLVVNPPSTQTAIGSTPRAPAPAPVTFPQATSTTSTAHRGPVQEIGTRRTTAVSATPSAQELQRYGVEQLASMPREKLVNLSADQRQHLNNYISGKANAAKYGAEANRSLIVETAKVLPQKAADAVQGAAEGAKAGGTNFIQGTTALGKQIANPSTYKDAASEVRDLARDPRGVGVQDGKILRQAGGAALDSTKRAASRYAEDIRKGDARAASRDVVEPTTELIADVATGKLVSRGAKAIGQVATGTSKATAPLRNEVGSAAARLAKQESNTASDQSNHLLRLGEKADSRILRQNLETTGVKSSPGNQAHHIIGEAYPEGVEARRILAKYGIDVNAPENGVFLPSRGGSMADKTAVHSGKHAREYEIDTLRRLKDAQTRDDAVAILSNIRNELLRGTIKLNEAN